MLNPSRCKPDLSLFGNYSNHFFHKIFRNLKFQHQTFSFLEIIYLLKRFELLMALEVQQLPKSRHIYIIFLQIVKMMLLWLSRRWKWRRKPPERVFFPPIYFYALWRVVDILTTNISFPIAHLRRMNIPLYDQILKLRFHVLNFSYFVHFCRLVRVWLFISL